MEDNGELLLASVQSGDFSNVEALDERIVVTAREKYVDFYCGGKGLAVSGCDYGFYYSKDDTPQLYASWVDGDGVLRQLGKGFYMEESGGGDRYYTEKIRDYFYYYESYF